MPSPRSSSSPLFVLALIATGVAASLAGPLAPAVGEPAFVRAASQAFVWSPEQVQTLMEEIAASADRGLDPSDYGLAALKGERLQATELLEADGSPQLDMLADSAALALANAYQSKPVSRADLHAAMRQGRLRPWLQSLRYGKA